MNEVIKLYNPYFYMGILILLVLIVVKLINKFSGIDKKNANIRKWMESYNGETQLNPYINNVRITQYPYIATNCLFTATELKFFLALINIIAGKYHVFAKVSLKDILLIPNNTSSYMHYFGRIAQKHIDFVICNNCLEPIFCIELDDSSHYQKHRQQRDIFLNDIFKCANLPLLRIPARYEYNTEYILHYINPFIQSIS